MASMDTQFIPILLGMRDAAKRSADAAQEKVNQAEKLLE